MPDKDSRPLDDVLDLSPGGDQPARLEDEIDRALRLLERALYRQLNVVLHDPRFRALEKTWRELDFLVSAAGADSGVCVDALSVSPDDLRRDIVGSDRLSRTGLFQKLFVETWRRPGETPYLAAVLEWELGKGNEDMETLARLAALGAAVHMPFLVGMKSAFLGAPSFTALDRLADLETRMQGMEYAKWRALREEDESRFVAACAVGFALRQPYGESLVAGGLPGFSEDTWRGGAPAVLWGNPAFALAAVIARAHEQEGVIMTLHGQRAGRIADPVPAGAGPVGDGKALRLEAILPADKALSVAMNGANLLCLPDPARPPCFLSAQTAFRPRTLGDRETTVQMMCASRLSWVLFASWIAHALAQLFQDRPTPAGGLGAWQATLSEFVDRHTARDMAPDFPFRRAVAEVSAPEENPGWLLAHVEVVPARGWEEIEDPLHVDVWLPAEA